jgi:hypothetical protein
MKFVKIFNQRLKLLLISLLVILSSLLLVVKAEQDGEPSPPVLDASLKASKYLFMYKYSLVQNEPEHKLNVFTYKNILFSQEEIVYFGSTNEADPVRII